MVWTSKNCPKPPVSSEELPRSYPVTSDAFRTMKLWFEQQIENAQQDQISGFAERSERGTIRGEKAHSRHCAMFDALQMFLSEFGTGPVAQAAVNPLQALYDEVNALGGRPDQDNSYDQGIVDTVAKVLEIIEKAQAAYSLSSTNRVCPRCKIELLDPVLLGAPEEGHICGACWAEDRHSALSSTYPQCTCAAIVNPNIPHARFCPLSSTDHKS